LVVVAEVVGWALEEAVSLVVEWLVWLLGTVGDACLLIDKPLMLILTNR
jgi:uncharacterized membrane protein